MSAPDSEISRIVYVCRDRIIEQLKLGLQMQLVQLSDSELTDTEYLKLSKDVAGLRDFIEGQTDDLVMRLEAEVETLCQWRIEHDPNIYTGDDLNELMEGEVKALPPKPQNT